jgi:hypothetical protein
MGARGRPPHGPRRRAADPADSIVRRHICAEAARIVVEEGVRDYQTAKRKAIARLNLPSDKNLPGNDEIEAAVAEYLRLFRGARRDSDLKRLRGIALEAMDVLARFEPRLVGAVLSGNVTADTPIQFHVTADTPEEVGLWLHDRRIPFEQGERRVRFGGERQETVPRFRFSADGVTIELCVFAREDARESPLSPVDGRPMKRANRREVERLLAMPENNGVGPDG